MEATKSRSLHLLYAQTSKEFEENTFMSSLQQGGENYLSCIVLQGCKQEIFH